MCTSPPSEHSARAARVELSRARELSETAAMRLGTPDRNRVALFVAADAVEEFADTLLRIHIRRREAEGATAELLSALTEIEHMKANLSRVRNPVGLQIDELWPLLDDAYQHGLIAIDHLRWSQE